MHRRLRETLRTVADHDIKFIRLWFTDILGFQRVSRSTAS